MVKMLSARNYEMFVDLEVSLLHRHCAVYSEPCIADQVTFSSKAQLLVSAFGRSSKPSPRFLIAVRAMRILSRRL